MCSKGNVSPSEEELTSTEQNIEEPPAKEKKKKRHKEKRKRSCSAESTSSNSSHKRHKKKKKKKRRDEDPPSPRVNPIFLWVKQDHTKIVEVLCEDYDKRNRIRLTKTPGGWVAIPRTARMCSNTPPEPACTEDPPPEILQEPPFSEGEEDDDDVKIIELPKEDPIVIEVEDSDDETKEMECNEEKYRTDPNVDENHNNNESEGPIECNEYCGGEVVQEVISDDDDDKDILKEQSHNTKTHQENCENLMNELADICFAENFKDEEDRVLEDIYTFVPSSPEVEKDELKGYLPVHDIKKPATPDPAPINLVVHSDRDKVPSRAMKEEPLKPSELESLDILWRLPEGTTISHSKPLEENTASEEAQPIFSLPVQEEPLNLGKPKPKEVPEVKTPSNPLDQLKEVLSDPDLTVPDPLLVPRGRLQALIANPGKEIPRLLKKRQFEYPKIDTDLMVVSLSHLQSILQGGDAYQRPEQMNQMLWLPYLEMKQNQELMTMLYPHYLYPPQYPQAAARYHPWPRPETSKPALLPKEQPKQNLRLKVKEQLIDPNFKRTSLLNLDPPPFVPPLGVPPNSNLWHPLFSSPDGKYTSKWNWTTPVTVGQ